MVSLPFDPRMKSAKGVPSILPFPEMPIEILSKSTGTSSLTKRCILSVFNQLPSVPLLNRFVIVVVAVLTLPFVSE